MISFYFLQSLNFAPAIYVLRAHNSGLPKGLLSFKLVGKVDPRFLVHKI